MRERDGDTGQFSEVYPFTDFLDALETLGGSAGTQEVADEVGCQYRTANAKLHELEDDGRISSRRIGNAYLWTLQ